MKKISIILQVAAVQQQGVKNTRQKGQKMSKFIKCLKREMKRKKFRKRQVMMSKLGKIEMKSNVKKANPSREVKCAKIGTNSEGRNKEGANLEKILMELASREYDGEEKMKKSTQSHSTSAATKRYYEQLMVS